MDKLDQPRPEDSPIYDPAIALEFFRSAGKPENFKQGETIFAEHEKAGRLFKRDKMYLLLEGEVNLMAKSKFIGIVRAGEIFGEMASISQTPRSATAIAKAACRVIALDDKQFQNALQKKPEFALMLMSIIIGRLRNTISRLQASSALSGAAASRESRVFDRKLLANLVHALGHEAMVRYDRDKIIMKEGQVGVLMYVVLEGRVAVSIQGSIVERIGPGGVFGEMALVERSPRLASAVAETDCALLAINRNAFLNLMKSQPEFGLTLLSAVGERARFMTSRAA